MTIYDFITRSRRARVTGRRIITPPPQDHWNKERALDFKEEGRGDVFDPHKRLIAPSCEIHIGFKRLGRVGLNGFTQPINMG